MKKLALLILLLVGCVSLQAQTASKPASNKLTLTGKVVSSDGEPVIGATIMVEGSKPMIATAAGVDGSYSLTLPSGSVSLTVSSIGYNSRTVPVNNRTKLDITLETEDQEIDDVVVVGYKVQKKVTLTGSVSAISGKDIVKRDAPNLSSALQGLMPGVSVVQASGRPGADGGEKCESFEACKALIKDKKKIQYFGKTGIGPFNKNNDPSSANIGIFEYDGNNVNVFQDMQSGDVPTE